MQDGRTCATDKYATEMTHEPFLGDLVSMHNQICDCMSPTSTHNLKASAQVPQLCMVTKLPGEQ